MRTRRSARATKSRRRRVSRQNLQFNGPERLEDRQLLTIEPLTLADPQLFGDSPNGDSNLPSMSADGQLVVFQSTADDLVPNDFNNASDIFLYNRTTGDVSLVSVNAKGTASGMSTPFGTANSSNPVISRDGRFVAFESGARDLVEGVVTVAAHSDVFVRDLQTQTTFLVSANRDNPLQDGSNQSFNPLLSGDGQTVVFRSHSTDLATGIDGTHSQLYAWDFETKQTELISINRDGTAPGNGISNYQRQFSVSGDGRFVAFRSNSSDLVSIDDNGIDQIYLRDRELQTTELVSIDSLGGIGGNGHSEITSRGISDDGRYVTFYSNAANLHELSRAFTTSVYVRDMQEDVTSLVSISHDGTQAVVARFPAISADGSRIAYHSPSSSLITNDNNSGSDVFVRDITTNETILVSENAQGTGTSVGTRAINLAIAPTISPDGRFVAFYSESVDLVTQSDTNEVEGVFGNSMDVFVRDLQTGSTRLASVTTDGESTGDRNSYTNADPIFHLGIGLSDDGQTVAFESVATDLFPEDNNRRSDVFIRELDAERTQLASPLDPYLPTERLANFGGALQSISEDGRYVAFVAGNGDFAFDVVLDEPLPFGQSAIFVRDRQIGSTILGSKGATPDCLSGGDGRLSADGRFLAFSSVCALDSEFPYVPGPQHRDVFVRDLLLGATKQITVSADGSEVGNSGSAVAPGNLHFLHISQDGRYVAFLSFASNLVDGVTINGGNNIFVHDTQTGTTRLVNQVAGGNENSPGFFPTILGFSKNGSRLLFQYQVSGDNIVAESNDNNNARDIYVYDLAGPDAFETKLVSANVDGDAANTHSGFDNIGATISDDGNFVAFSSWASDIVPSTEVNNSAQIYVRDIEAETTSLISFNTSGANEALGNSNNPIISSDGGQVLFESRSNNLTNQGGNGFTQLYVRDLDGQTTTLITANVDGTQPGDSHSGNFDNFHEVSRAWSPNGRFYAFESLASNLVADHESIAQPNGQIRNLYLYDFDTSETSVVNYTNSGTFSTGEGAATNSNRVSKFVTDSGEVFFSSHSGKLIQQDRNNVTDTFVYKHEGRASISGNLFDDTNADGSRDASENGLPYWTVYVDENLNRRFDAGERNVQTDVEGNYRFTGLPEGDFAVRLQVQAGFGVTTTHSFDVDLGTGQQATVGAIGVSKSNVDLITRNVKSSATGSPGATIDVAFTVVNSGANAAGSWQDAIYLSPTKSLTADSILLRTIAHEGGLIAGRSYDVRTSVVLPTVASGSFFVIAETDRRFQVINDTARTNNSAAAGSPIQIEIQSLTLNEPFASGFQSTGQGIYFKVEVKSGETLQIAFDSASASGGVELYTRFGKLPTAFDFDHAARDFGKPDQTLSVPSTRPGTYFILAKSRFGEPASSAFNISANVAPFELNGISPAIGSNSGSVTIQLDGSSLTPTSRVTLIRNGNVIAASQLQFRDASTIFASFDLMGEPLGSYDVRIEDGSRFSALPTSFTVTEQTQADHLAIVLVVPEVVRSGRPAKLLVEYENTGMSNLAAPLLQLSAENATFRGPGETDFAEGPFQFVAISHDGPAGILRPGARSQIEIEFIGEGSLHSEVNFELSHLPPDRDMNWQAEKDGMRPSDFTEDAWEPVFTNLVADLGTTAADLETFLAEQASYLSDLGIYTSSIERLMRLSIKTANNDYFEIATAATQDAVILAPDFPLEFARSHRQSINGRYTLGPFGRGWSHGWQIQTTTQENGDVTVRHNSTSRLYRRMDDGTYESQAHDKASLSSTADGLILTEVNGDVTRFLADGRMDYYQNNLGIRVTAGYDANDRLTSLSHSSGARITLKYNDRGLFELLTESTGETVAYEYDDTGEHLVRVTTRLGTYAYNYILGQGQAREHALRSVQFPDATIVQFDYDTRGRISHERGGPVNEISFSYPGAGSMVIDSGSSSVPAAAHFDDRGLIGKWTDPTGRLVNFQYDPSGNRSRVDLGKGIELEATSDENGNEVTVSDLLGRVTSFEYDHNGNRTGLTDARGQRWSFDVNENNRTTRIDYPHGTQDFDYDTRGNLSGVTFGRSGLSKGLSYDTNSAGQVTKKTFSDGSIATYTYDAHQQLLTATDAGGTINFSYHDHGLLKKADYPDGTSLSFQYNAAGARTQIKDETGFEINYSYDSAGRPEKITNESASLLTTYVYDSVGRLTQQQNSNGTSTAYGFDEFGQLTSIIHLAADGTENASYQYTYDTLGRHTSITLTDSEPNTPDGTTSYQYDAMGQLLRVRLPDGSETSYEYDDVGNRIRVVDGGTTTSYQTNGGNQYTRAGDSLYTYDIYGNISSKTDEVGTTNYSYDDEFRLTRIKGADTDISYTYDALGNRNSATVNGVTTNYVIDPVGLSRVVRERDGSGNTIANYVYGIGLASRVSAGAAAFYEFDAIGNVVGLTDGVGDYLNRFSYDPFGDATPVRHGVETPFGFGGQYGAVNDGSGLTYLRARSYDTELGRFLSPDSIGLAGGDTNIYAYAGNDPLNRIDPSGHFIVAAAGVGAAVGAVVGVASAYAANGGHPTAGQIAGGLASGAFGGAAAGITAASFGTVGIVGGMLTGAVGNAFGEAVSQQVDTGGANDWGAIGGAGLIGGITGGLGNFLPKFGPRFGQPLPTGSGLKPFAGNQVMSAAFGKLAGGVTQLANAFDPNDIIGPAGVGPGNYILPNQTLPYLVRFENLKDASAPAQEVFVTHPLDEDLDLSTFELDQIGFADVVIDVPRGLQSFQTSVDYQNIDGSPLRVDLSAELDIESRTVTWTFLSVDPFTGSYPPGVFDGFLPPNTDPPVGEGFLSYTIRPIEDLPSGTRIAPTASIVFDFNDPIMTPPIFNTIDAETPSSQVDPFPAFVASNEFTVTWSGTDEAGGSGIDRYDIFVSDNDGPFEVFIEGSGELSASFTGQPGHTYSFYSVAVDLVGHRETVPKAADARTRVTGGASPGDLDNDGELTPADVDLLCGAIRRGDDVNRLDLNGDGMIDVTDLRFFVKTLAATSFGDANLNGIFNSSDLVAVFEVGQYEDDIDGNSGWAQGDWNCDGDFSSSDFVIAFQDGGYTTAAVGRGNADNGVAGALMSTREEFEGTQPENENDFNWAPVEKPPQSPAHNLFFEQVDLKFFEIDDEDLTVLAKDRPTGTAIYEEVIGEMN